MENNIISISIIIPCHNEENFIDKCLDSILLQDYPKDRIEILIIDGMSTDRTREIINIYIKRFNFIKIIDNVKRIIPAALNLGINEAEGEIIVRMDAHTLYPKDYIAKCIKYLNEYKADNVGGVIVNMGYNDSFGKKNIKVKAIAIALSSLFGVGNAYFRIGIKTPRFVDTVPFGCYRRKVFKKNGLFDEDLLINEDAEFNHRLIRNGGKVLLVPAIISFYYVRDTYAKLFKTYSKYGYFRVLTAKKIRGIIGFRQLVPLMFVVSLMFCLLLSFLSPIFFILFFIELSCYILLNIIISMLLSIRGKDLRLFPLLIITFSIVHFSYGFGYLKGILDFLILRKNKADNSKIAITR